eukprot:TRINITY_DN43515_c0_g1_i1.p1 TRINITY_DN43515_c0_g1~~TRINITY_DN43515_c0_g1_i1.p1  ORF type:complete len:249 (-),score=18.26 TRINITY_DN43515_c0_g1_i1:105-851(-)
MRSSPCDSARIMCADASCTQSVGQSVEKLGAGNTCRDQVSVSLQKRRQRKRKYVAALSCRISFNVYNGLASPVIRVLAALVIAAQVSTVDASMLTVKRYATLLVTCCCVLISAICGAVVVLFLVSKRLQAEDEDPWTEFEDSMGENASVYGYPATTTTTTKQLTSESTSSTTTVGARLLAAALSNAAVILPRRSLRWRGGANAGADAFDEDSSDEKYLDNRLLSYTTTTTTSPLSRSTERGTERLVET